MESKQEEIKSNGDFFSDFKRLKNEEIEALSEEEQDQYADELKEIILTSIRENEAEKGYEDEFGARYSVEIRVEKNNREIKIITSWIIKAGEDFPRLTSCYIQD